MFSEYRLHEGGEVGVDCLKESPERERKVLADLVKVMNLLRR